MFEKYKNALSMSSATLAFLFFIIVLVIGVLMVTGKINLGSSRIDDLAKCGSLTYRNSYCAKECVDDKHILADKETNNEEDWGCADDECCCWSELT